MRCCFRYRILGNGLPDLSMIVRQPAADLLPWDPVSLGFQGLEIPTCHFGTGLLLIPKDFPRMEGVHDRNRLIDSPINHGYSSTGATVHGFQPVCGRRTMSSKVHESSPASFNSVQSTTTLPVAFANGRPNNSRQDQQATGK